MKKIRQRGITLIALVITIIVLLILAGVAINLALNGGLIEKTENAVAKHNEAAMNEQKALNKVIDFIDNVINGNTTYTTYTDTDGRTAKIPKGFTVSTFPEETKITDGLVVIAPDGSEFVWVPVANPVLDVQGKDDIEIDSAIQAEVVAGRYPMAIKINATDYKSVAYNFYGTPSMTIEKAASGHNEPEVMTYITGYDDTASNYTNAEITGITDAAQFKVQLQNEYNQMVESVMIHGGFYIGRYETSLNGVNVQSKANIEPMTASISSGNKWYGMYQKQKLYVSDNNITGVKSGMIWGNQWDQIMIWMKDINNPNIPGAKYIVDSTGMGWYSDNSGNSVKNTGTLPGAKVKNIYDMAGNVWEWTMEGYGTTGRFLRGGYYDSTGDGEPANSRPYYDFSTSTSTKLGSRVQLYL
jgi:hypothetical protein